MLQNFWHEDVGFVEAFTFFLSQINPEWNFTFNSILSGVSNLPTNWMKTKRYQKIKSFFIIEEISASQ